MNHSHHISPSGHKRAAATPLRAARATLAACLSACLCVGLCTCLTACATTGLSNDGIYREDKTSFRLTAPPASAWEPVKVDGTDLAWNSREKLGVIAVNAECEKNPDAPLNVLMNHLLMGFTMREPVLEESVTLAERDAFHTIYNAELDGVPIRFEAWVVKRDGCLYDLQYIAGPDAFPRGRPAFQGVVRGFAPFGTGVAAGAPAGSPQ